MLILAVDSSAKMVSVAAVQDGVTLGEFYLNTKQTHSETLMPLLQMLLQTTNKRINDLDLLAVTAGPGSFTGIRIGIASVKGLAFAGDIPCCGVSTLEAIAYGALSYEGKVICTAMDARCGQVYNALFQIENGVPRRLCEDRAVTIEALSAQCEQYGDRLVLCGDGAALCYEQFNGWGAVLAPETIRYQRASSAALAAAKLYASGETVQPGELVPYYLRLPQAERELKKKKGESV